MSRFFASSGISPSNEYSGLISLGVDWFDLLAVRGTLRVFSSTTVWRSAFFVVQFSHLYMIIEKAIALTIQTSVSKVISLLFNMLSRFVIIFLPGNKFLLILWLQSLSAVISEPRKIKSVTVSTFSPSICHKVKELDDSLS